MNFNITVGYNTYNSKAPSEWDEVVTCRESYFGEKKVPTFMDTKHYFVELFRGVHSSVKADNVNKDGKATYFINMAFPASDKRVAIRKTVDGCAMQFIEGVENDPVEGRWVEVKNNIRHVTDRLINWVK